MRTPSSALLLGLGLALAGCGPINRGVESVNQPIVSRTDYTFDVATGGDGLVPGEAQRLDAWFSTLKVRYGDRVTVDDRTTYGADARGAVASLLSQRGLMLSGTAPVTEGAVAPGAARVIVSRAEATVPDCPNFGRPALFEFAASSMSNYGCAVNSNLAMMTASPEDLIDGREADGIDAQSTSKAIKAYRALAPSGASGSVKAESSKGGN